MSLVRALWRQLAASKQHPAVATIPVVAFTTGAMYLLGSACGLLLVVVDPPGTHLLWLTLAPVFGLAAGAVTLRFGRRFPRWMFHVCVVGGNALTTAEIVLGRGTPVAGATMAIYLFVVLDAAFFFPLLGVALHMAHVLLVTTFVLPHVGIPWQTVVTFNGVCIGVALVVASISRAADAAEEDPLTHLANRRGLDRRLREALDRARTDGMRLSLVLLDLDGFKEINDRHGHQRGDELLKMCAQRWRSVAPKHVVIGRYGGDEFAIVVPGGTLGSAADLADALREVLAPDVAASAGVAAWEPGDSASMLLSRADVALYDAKAAGRNQTAVYGDPGRASSELETAIRRGELVLHYQPLVRLTDRAVVGVEALVRWAHPSRGLVPPLEFVPQAERTGAIRSLGAWTLDEACRAAGESDQQLASVSVNVSVRELRDPDYVGTVRETLARYGLPGSRLMLEVTEGIYDEGDPQVVRTLHEVRALGVRIAIDDFGSGYSSLRWLDRLPLDVLKIDGTFIDSIQEGSPEAPILEAIVAMARSLGVDVIAERVETEHQARVLAGLGCDLGQGFLFGRPEPFTVDQPVAG
ncbi:bifunctional diguanylate cyclase/phosphodiesterase [Nocardioides sp. CER19]|uniref:putative bifunctional diguanylate cyclase/phosphodiesterase n=1 Tax=Nocardioides sp. CER19 TaxID=3038538 RepID=UPI002449B4B1|nr:bifunctional diguanylate cyclase/phosphodiesterase [Nocardioides sp. CER19]MDH2416601.1 bifunctional diguanylate cyclase/phosphodiesterase [Nocardioides sp. CER19]